MSSFITPSITRISLILIVLTTNVFADITGEIHATTGTSGQTLTGETTFEGPIVMTGGDIQFSHSPEPGYTLSGVWDGAGIVGDFYDDRFGEIYAGGFELYGGHVAGGWHIPGWSQLYSLDAYEVKMSEYDSSEGKSPNGTGTEASTEFYVGSFQPTSYWLSQRQSPSSGQMLDHFAFSGLVTTGANPGVAQYVEVVQHTTGANLQEAYFTWHRATTPPPSETLNDHFATIESRSVLAMSFGGPHNILKLLHPSNSANTIEINPNAGSISINGQPVLTESNAAATFLTVTQAQTDYLRNDISSLPLGGRQPLVPNGIPIGTDSYAEENAVSIGVGAGRVDSNPASGLNSISIGVRASARELDTIAIGDMAAATNDGAIAIGLGASATEAGAIALGMHTVANQFDQVVLGAFNLPSAPSVVQAPADDLFVLGNGTNEENRSNAFVIKRNGDVMVMGELNVEGDSTFEGVVRVRPAGDIGMGEFTAGPQP